MPVTAGPHGDVGLTPIFFKQVLVSNLVLAFEIPPGVIPRRAVLTVHTNGLRVCWVDQVLPTTTEGHLIQASGGAVSLSAIGELIGEPAIRAFRMIRDGTVDAEAAYTIEV